MAVTVGPKTYASAKAVQYLLGRVHDLRSTSDRVQTVSSSVRDVWEVRIHGVTKAEAEAIRDVVDTLDSRFTVDIGAQSHDAVHVEYLATAWGDDHAVVMLRFKDHASGAKDKDRQVTLSFLANEYGITEAEAALLGIPSDRTLTDLSGGSDEAVKWSYSALSPDGSTATVRVYSAVRTAGTYGVDLEFT